MRKIITLIIMLSSIIYASNSSMKHKTMFQSVPLSKAILLQDSKEKLYCPSCGMTLPMFYKTNHSAELNGHVKQYCSLHCLVEDNIKNNNKLKNIQVVDVISLKFIKASSATYVVGSSKKGTMTMVSKYAFSNKKDAEAFAKKFGGKIMTFKEAYLVASKDLNKEIKVISKKQHMMSKKGQMIYTKMCKKTDEIFNSVAEAKAFVVKENLCKNLNGKKLQAVGLFLYNR